MKNESNIINNIDYEEDFLKPLSLTVTEVATLRGQSRQYVTRELESGRFFHGEGNLMGLCRVLLTIDTERSRDLAAKIRDFAQTKLHILLDVGLSTATAAAKTPNQLLSEARELWVWSDAPVELEHPGYWDTLRAQFLDQEGKLLVYFVPNLEVAEQLSNRFEMELAGRKWDSEGREIGNKFYGATVFVIVTSMTVVTPYLVITDAGSCQLSHTAKPAAWALGGSGEDFFELPNKFARELIRKLRTIGIGVSKDTKDFFPLGQDLKSAGIPFQSYPHVDHLYGVKYDQPLGLFDGLQTEQNEEAEPRRIEHPLLHYPVFIRAYRKLPNHDPKNQFRPERRKMSFFNF
ncbi:MAG: hypothetical protein IPL99_08395 [Candidatus Competibacteraceae bacterium]|nr:hypothetical protein [Candidatus Competibacteraceae bacterium]